MSYAHCCVSTGLDPQSANAAMDRLLAAVADDASLTHGVYVVVIGPDAVAAQYAAKAARQAGDSALSMVHFKAKRNIK
ncbi:hypothetical protein [Acidovorax temperans]|uniref:hypothetical protein n=1 Tax=Acidovorax temperans TaxID=80878 RepID=UPI0035AF6330